MRPEPDAESSSPPEKTFPAKAVAFWRRKEELRRQPGRCCRCGKPNANGNRQCDACREYAAKYRARKRFQKHGVMVDSMALADIERRLSNVEHYFARLSELQRASYNRGYCAGRRLRITAQERASYFDAMPRMSAQELRTISNQLQ